MTLAQGAGLRWLIIGLSALIAFQMIMAGLGFVVRANALVHPARQEMVSQIAAAARLFERLDGPGRADALTAASTPFLQFSTAKTYAEDHAGLGRAISSLRPLTHAYRQALGERDFRIYARRPRFLPPADPNRQTILFPFDTVVIVRLNDGSALIAEPTRRLRQHQAIAIAATWSSLLGLALLAGLVHASLSTTRPVRRMAEAAERLADDLDAPSIVEAGPQPVRDLARAFNRMQSDLRRLIAERTVALAAVAHDYRTYLTRLRLRVDFIEDDAQRDKAITDIDEMAALIDDTLLLAREGGPGSDAEPVDVVALARSVADAVIETGRAATFESAVPAAHVDVRRLALRRAVANLADNAVKYGAVAHIAVRRDGERTLIVVADDGDGAPGQDLERLTDPFVRGDSSRSRATGGAGLGLAIAKSLVESAGGAFSLSRGEARGLVAEIAFPAGDDAPSSAA